MQAHLPGADTARLETPCTHVGSRTGHYDFHVGRDLSVSVECGTEHAINGMGFGHREADGREPGGPCITGIIDLRGQPDVEAGMVVEEESAPGPLGTFMPEGLAAASERVSEPMMPGPVAAAGRAAREVESIALGPSRASWNGRR